MQANTEAYVWPFHKARELSELAVESALQSDYVERAALLEAEQAVREVEFERCCPRPKELAGGHCTVAGAGGTGAGGTRAGKGS